LWYSGIIVRNESVTAPVAAAFKEILIFTIAYGEVYTLHFGIFIVAKQLPLSVLWFDVQ
jgi:hypothetical protein